MRAFGALLAATLTLFLFGGCSSGSGPAPAPRPTPAAAAAVPSGSVGDPVSLVTDAGPVAVTLLGATHGSSGSMKFTVTITNSGGAVLGYGPGNFDLAGPDGRRYERDGSGTGQLQPGSALNPGRSVTGAVTFSAAPLHGVLMFTPDGAAAAAAEWPF